MPKSKLHPLLSFEESILYPKILLLEEIFFQFKHYVDVFEVEYNKQQIISATLFRKLTVKKG